MQYLSGESFLNELYSNMHNESIVSHGSLNIDSPEQKIANYINRLEDIYNKVKENNRLNILKRYYYNKYIIKELPNNYTDDNNLEVLHKIQDKQKEVLDVWIDYLISNDCNYPMWFKDYVFRGMIEMDNDILNNHNDNFLELNEEAIGNVYDVIYDYMENISLTYEQQQALSNGKTFGPIYIYYLNLINNKDDKSISKNNIEKKKRKSLLKGLFNL